MMQDFLLVRIGKSFYLFSSECSTAAEEVRYEVVVAEFFDKKIVTVRLDDAVFGHKIEKIQLGVFAKE